MQWTASYLQRRLALPGIIFMQKNHLGQPADRTRSQDVISDFILLHVLSRISCLDGIIASPPFCDVIKSFDLQTSPPIFCCDATSEPFHYILDASFLLRHALWELVYDRTWQPPLVLIGDSSSLECFARKRFLKKSFLSWVPDEFHSSPPSLNKVERAPSPGAKCVPNSGQDQECDFIDRFMVFKCLVRKSFTRALEPFYLNKAGKTISEEGQAGSVRIYPDDLI